MRLTSTLQGCVKVRMSNRIITYEFRAVYQLKRKKKEKENR